MYNFPLRAGGFSPDRAAQNWLSAVGRANYSNQRARVVDRLIRSLRDNGTWVLTDDIWLLAAENAVQSLISLKQLRTATAINSPTFAADRGYVFNGTTNYINTNFIPLTHAVAMTGTDMAWGVYERTNLASQGFHGAFMLTTRNLDLRPRSHLDTLGAAMNCSITSPIASLDGRGLSTGYRSGSTYGIARNGVSATTFSPASNGTTLPSIALFLGCENVNGVAMTFRAASVGYAVAGKSDIALSPAFCDAMQAYMTAVGANV